MAVFSSPSSFPSPICALDVDRLDGVVGQCGEVYQESTRSGVISKQDSRTDQSKASLESHESPQ